MVNTRRMCLERSIWSVKHLLLCVSVCVCLCCARQNTFKINEAYDANVYKLPKSRRKSKHVRILRLLFLLFFLFCVACTIWSHLLHFFSSNVGILFDILRNSSFFSSIQRMFHSLCCCCRYCLANQKHSQSTRIPLCRQAQYQNWLHTSI